MDSEFRQQDLGFLVFNVPHHPYGLAIPFSISEKKNCEINLLRIYFVRIHLHIYVNRV